MKLDWFGNSLRDNSACETPAFWYWALVLHPEPRGRGSAKALLSAHCDPSHVRKCDVLVQKPNIVTAIGLLSEL